MSERLLRLAEVAAELSVSLSTVKRLVRRGELPIVRVGASIRVRETDLRRFVAARTERRGRSRPSPGAAGVVVAKGERLWD